jgi:quinol monooxygenase YgiN
MPNSVHVIVKLQARAGKEGVLRTLLEEGVPLTLKEKGCRQCLLVQDRQNAAVLTFLEEWGTEADFDAHMALPRLQKLVAQLADVLVGPPDVARYSKVAGSTVTTRPTRAKSSATMKSKRSSPKSSRKR